MSSFNQESFEFTPETGNFEAEQFEWSGESEWGGESEVFNEAEVMELAGELLEVSNEAELDRFLGNFIRRTAGTLGRAINSPLGQQIGGLLKGVAKTALPMAGGALGGYVGGPLGAKIGSGLAAAAGSALGLEAEAEDREFEGAKKFVTMAGDAVKQAVSAPAGATASNAAAVAQAAVKAAAEKHVPGLLGQRSRSLDGYSRAGRWVRRGKNIILVNAA